MQMTIRRGEERGRTQTEWLDSWHTFSFDRYYDPRHMGFRSLRVINEDWVRPGAGFPTHPHRDMEIVTYVLEGSLEHRDSMGNGSVIRPGEVQRMSAGTGVTHSEFNASQSDPVHLLQIWILPERMGLPPSYEQKTIDQATMRSRWLLVASREGRDGGATIHQDAELNATRLAAGEARDYDLWPGRHAWVQVARGSVELDGARLRAGDAAAISDAGTLTLRALEDAEVLLFDLG